MSDWLPEEVVTGRLRLRQHEPQDEDDFVALLTDPDVRRYVGGARAEADVRARPLDRTWGHFAVADRTTNRMIGTLSFDQKRGPWEVSFQLRCGEWGKGLMCEALVAARDWFFAADGGDGFIAVTQLANVRTQRLLNRAGAQRGEEFKQHGAQQVEYAFHRNAP